jgi:coenzyme F420 hydrogenase subunit beta
MCTGCGTCSSASADGELSLTNIIDDGIRPVSAHAAGSDGRSILSICPGYQVDETLAAGDRACQTPSDHELGLVLQVWEGYAADAQIRFKASSGGILSALSLYCLEKLGMEFILHTGMDPQRPWLNRTCASRSREELLTRTGSRYAPASPCEGLQWIERSRGPCAMVGKPCDAAGAALLRRERPELDRRIGLVLTFFCAGVPSTRGTLDLLAGMEVRPEELTGLRYRGEGWPGGFKAAGKEGRIGFIPYLEAWGKLTRYRPLRCHLCPDGLGRIADISCGDAWHRFSGSEADPGRSIVLVRTPLGREVLRGAAQAGYVELAPSSAEEVLKAQPDLLQRRRQLYGRLLVFKALGIPIPRYKGYSLRYSWSKLPLSRKMRIIAGTFKRVLLRGWWKRMAQDTRSRKQPLRG